MTNNYCRGGEKGVHSIQSPNGDRHNCLDHYIRQHNAGKPLSKMQLKQLTTMLMWHRFTRLKCQKHFAQKRVD